MRIIRNQIVRLDDWWHALEDELNYMLAICGAIPAKSIGKIHNAEPQATATNFRKGVVPIAELPRPPNLSRNEPGELFTRAPYRTSGGQSLFA